MAYKKRNTRKSGGSRTGYASRKSSSRASSGKRAGTARRSVQTVRIVVEQPQAVSSAPQGSAPARKAVF